jgi:ubiquinone/menaquinone biosynthesis C-methylase UbiE
MTTTDAANHHTPLAPNHHADHPGFAGLSGYGFALLFSLGRRRGTGRLAVELTEVRAGDHVVDIGCGAGNAVRDALAAGATATGIDPSAEMLRVARGMTRRRARRATYLDGAAEGLPVADASATVAWSLACVHHWGDLEAGLGEVRRVLRPGGRFLAVERRTQPGADGLASHGWTDQQAAAFADRCRKAGLLDVSVDARQGHRGTLLAVLAHQPA